MRASRIFVYATATRRREAIEMSRQVKLMMLPGAAFSGGRQAFDAVHEEIHDLFGKEYRPYEHALEELQSKYINQISEAMELGDLGRAERLELLMYEEQEKLKVELADYLPPETQWSGNVEMLKRSGYVAFHNDAAQLGQPG